VEYLAAGLVVLVLGLMFVVVRLVQRLVVLEAQLRMPRNVAPAPPLKANR